MRNDIIKKAQASLVMFTLGTVMFFPFVSHQSESLTPLSSRDNSSWWNSEWPYRKLLTIDHTNVNGNLQNFPVLISRSSDPELAAATQPAGQDIVFVWYADNVTVLNYEIEFFDHATGRLVAWVNLPYLSATSDTKLWMYFGNPTCGPQENIPGTWDNGYVMVQHLNETGNLISDSTGYHNNGVSSGTNHTDAGKIDGAQLYNGNDKIVINNFTTTPNALTLETWVYRDYTPFIYIACKGIYSQTSTDWILYLRNNQTANQGIDFSIKNHTSYIRKGDTPTGCWFYLAATYDYGSIALYMNATQIGAASGWPAIPNNFPHLGLGNDYQGNEGGLYPMTDVRLDELRVSNIARNSSWIITGFTNQNNPACFTIVGSEEKYEYSLTTTSDPPSGGTVSASPLPPYYYNNIVTLTAVANPGYRFDHWSGDLTGNSNPTTITMDANKVVTAHFTQNVYTLALIVDPIDGGIITASPAPPYHYNDIVTLTAFANPGFVFDHWSGDLSGNTNPTTLIMNANKTVVASFISGNTPPVAVNDSVIVLENSLNNSINVLANDYDLDGDTLMITAVSQPSHGTSSEDGLYIYYTPYASYTGSDSLTYTISDGHGGNAVATVFVTVLPFNNPPYMPNTPDPANGTTNVSIGADLAWNGGDPDPGDIVHYDVFFGSTSSPSLVSSNQSTTTYDPGILAYDTTYYWRIVSWDDHKASTKGPLWHFTTQHKAGGITVSITRPRDHSLYLLSIRLLPLPRNTILIGPITITAKVTADLGVDRVEFYIDGKLKKTDTSVPYTYHWGLLKFFKHVITVRAYDINAQMAFDELSIMKW
jgi:uncharacterized repeat protein (TIGR02543 family)